MVKFTLASILATALLACTPPHQERMRSAAIEYKPDPAPRHRDPTVEEVMAICDAHI